MLIRGELLRRRLLRHGLRLRIYRLLTLCVYRLLLLQRLRRGLLFRRIDHLLHYGLTLLQCGHRIPISIFGSFFSCRG